VAYKKQSKDATHSKYNKAIFVFAVIWVINQFGPFIEEDGPGFVEANPVLFQISCRLSVIPFEAKSARAIV